MNKNTSNVWVSINKNGQKILNIDNGKFVYKQNIDQIIFLNVSRDIIEKRIMGRLTCIKCDMTLNKFFNKEQIELHPCGKEYLVKRKDDNNETVIKRYDTYMSTTKPVLDHYSKNINFTEIDGTAEIQVITGKIDDILKV